MTWKRALDCLTNARRSEEPLLGERHVLVRSESCELEMGTELPLVQDLYIHDRWTVSCHGWPLERFERVMHQSASSRSIPVSTGEPLWSIHGDHDRDPI